MAEISIGGENIRFGVPLASEATTANCLFGETAGKELAAKSEKNTLIGVGAGEAIKTGKGNVCIGNNAGLEITTGSENVCLGSGAGNKTEGNSNNVFIGAGAGKENKGKENIFIGFEAGIGETGNSKLLIANNKTTPIIKGVMSETAGSNELTLGTVGGKVGLYGGSPASKAAEIKTLAAFETGVSAFKTEAQAKAIRDELTKVIEALKGIGVCV
jgi:hypothetical protein